MKIAYVIKSESNMGAVERRRLSALIPYWMNGNDVFPWKKNVSCDVIYIVNLPSVLKIAAQVFKYKKKNQATIVGMVEDFDTSKWASMCDESVNDITKLIAVNRCKKDGLGERIRQIRNWFSVVGLLQTDRRSTEKFIKNASAVMCTSELQAASLRRYNPFVTSVADCIPDDDYKIYDYLYFESLIKNKIYRNQVVIVWEGTAWGLQLLELIREPINLIANRSNLKFILRVVMPKSRPRLFGNTENEIILKQRFSCDVEFYEWNILTVGALVRSADIGIAPQANCNPFYMAKAFSKPLVYMTCGLPVVASDIHSYRELIQNDINGYVVNADSEWESTLLKLICNKELRERVGIAAKRRVDEFHSVEIVAEKIIKTFETARSIARI